jgi:hypothetical protein
VAPAVVGRRHYVARARIGRSRQRETMRCDAQDMLGTVRQYSEIRNVVLMFSVAVDCRVGDLDPKDQNQ